MKKRKKTPLIYQACHFSKATYRTRAIITRGLNIFYPLFEDHFFFSKEIFSENSVVMYGQYLRAVSNQKWVMMEHVQ